MVQELVITSLALSIKATLSTFCHQLGEHRFREAVTRLRKDTLSQLKNVVNIHLFTSCINNKNGSRQFCDEKLSLLNESQTGPLDRVYVPQTKQRKLTDFIGPTY